MHFLDDDAPVILAAQATPFDGAPSTIRFVRVAADAGYSVEELNEFVQDCRRIRVGSGPEAQSDDELPDRLPCWLDNGHEYVRVGEVVDDDTAPMLSRLHSHRLFLQNGGIGERAIPAPVFRGRALTQFKGRPVFVVDLGHSRV
ncbi:MAG: hypothetical protein E6Q67_09850 [Roseateles sp.]|nr:MAG: hypothetical protein E6Q67_09850 [Roseateles sp.]